MSKPHSSLEDPETPRPHEAVANIEGHRISRVNRLYGGAMSLHLGEMVRGHRGDRGRWIITSWGGDWIVQGSQGTLDSRKDDEEEVQTALERTAGDQIVKASVDAATLDLTVALDSGVILRLLVDRAYDGDAWTLSLPTGATISVHSTGEWSVQADSAGDQ